MSERAPDDVTATPVERDEIEVMFVRTEDEPVAMRRGWERLEALVGLRGRKFFGAFDPSTRAPLPGPVLTGSWVGAPGSPGGA